MKKYFFAAVVSISGLASAAHASPVVVSQISCHTTIVDNDGKLTEQDVKFVRSNPIVPTEVDAVAPLFPGVVFSCGTLWNGKEDLDLWCNFGDNKGMPTPQTKGTASYNLKAKAGTQTEFTIMENQLSAAAGHAQLVITCNANLQK